MWFLFLWAAIVVVTDALPNKPYLLYSNRTNVGAIHLKTHVRTDVIAGLHNVIPLDVDNIQNKLYYGEATLGNIYRSDMDGSNRENILTDVGRIEGIAVDWVGRSIYWTSNTLEKIMVATLDGRHRKILVNTGVQWPRGLAVDPSAGYLFWTDWGFKAAVERSTLSGGGRKLLIDKHVTNWPNGITLDYSRKRVYWIDASHETITSTDYDGGQRTTIFEDVFLHYSKFHAFDLDFFRDSIYWSHWKKNAIVALNITTSKIIANISIPSWRYSLGVMGVVIVDPSRQPAASNPCGSNNGGCQHLCLLEPNNNFKCECEIGTKLDQDGKSCIDAFKDEFLMFVDADAAKIYQLQTDEINVEPVPIKFTANLSRPVALEFDPVEDRVYWTDVTREIICRAFRNGSGYEEIVTENVGVADGLTIDLAGRNLYWTSTTHNTIEVSRFDGSWRRELINTSLDEPRDIIVDPIGGYMYWTDWGISAKIERASMDGSNRIELVNINIHWPNGLTIDHVNDKLYWADAYEDSIEILELKTGRRNVIINEKMLLGGYLYRLKTQVNHPYGLTLLHEFIYWTDWRLDSVYRAQINTGAEITLLASNLGKPMDIHAYNINQTQQYKKNYTFSFPKTGSNFTCIRSRTCPPMDPAPPCPAGYKTSRVNQTCGLYCRNIVGYTWRCPCQNWQECAVRERYFYGCASGYYASYNVRECVQIVKVGRCPYKNKGSVTCINDEACSGTQKCCNSKCTEPATIATHPCQKNNGDCGPGQLCLAVPGGHRCKCGSNLICVNPNPVFSHCPTNITSGTDPGVATRVVTWNVPTALDHEKHRTTVTVKPSHFVPPRTLAIGVFNVEYQTQDKDLRTSTCRFSITIKDLEPPSFGNTCPKNIIKYVDTKDDVIVTWTEPTAKDNVGVVSVQKSNVMSKYPVGKTTSVSYIARDAASLNATCLFTIKVIIIPNPVFSHCPTNITSGTDPGVATRVVNWNVPTALDHEKHRTTVTVKPSHFVPPRTLAIGVFNVEYQTQDKDLRTSTCRFSITIKDLESPSFGNTCPKNIIKYVDSKDDVIVTWTEPTAKDNVGVVRVQKSNVMAKYPVGKTTSVSYIARDAAGLTATCLFTIKVINVCDGAPCGFGAACVLTSGNNYKCVQCGSACTQEYKPVCGSDGKNYTNQCNLQLASCMQQKNITLVQQGKCGTAGDCTAQQCPNSKQHVCGSNAQTYENKCKLDQVNCVAKGNIVLLNQGKCGCDGLKMDADDKASNTVNCTLVNNVFACKVTCNKGYDAPLPGFLNLQCNKNKWIRGNNAGKYVPVNKSPPTCYKTASTSNSDCSSGYELMYRGLCVPCPPGSYLSSDTDRCQACKVTEYQDEKGQTSCQPCKSSKTSLTTGAESCYFNHGSNEVDLVFKVDKTHKYSQDGLRKELAKALTDFCSENTCSFKDNKPSRRKRDSVQYKFDKDHIIIVSAEEINENKGRKVVIFVLDPTSTERIPTKAFSTKNVTKVLLKVLKTHPLRNGGVLESVGGIIVVNPGSTGPTDPTKSGTDKPNFGLIAGVTLGTLCFIAVAVGIFIFTRRRKHKSRPESSQVPPVQYSQGSGGRVIRIGAPVAPDDVYEDPDTIVNDGRRFAFTNQVFNVNQPPPYYATTPIRNPAAAAAALYEQPNVYETPVDANDWVLPGYKPLADDGVVYLKPLKQGVYLSTEKSRRAEMPVMYSKNRASGNVYSLPQGEQPRDENATGAEGSLRLEPPPRYDDARLVITRGQTASSVLPNVRRTNDNEGGMMRGRDYAHELRDVPKGQSES